MANLRRKYDRFILRVFQWLGSAVTPSLVIDSGRLDRLAVVAYLANMLIA
jgi:hypothetical protein